VSIVDVLLPSQFWQNAVPTVELWMLQFWQSGFISLFLFGHFNRINEFTQCLFRKELDSLQLLEYINVLDHSYDIFADRPIRTGPGSQWQILQPAT
jgi:hypothetical protein